MLIVAVLIVVLLWWALVFPHTTRYQRAKNESLVKEAGENPTPSRGEAAGP
jgi:hypothetical protein